MGDTTHSLFALTRTDESRPRHRLWRVASILVVAWGVLMLQAATTQAATTCPTGATMNVVAHPDDDLLFQSPDLLHDVQSGKCVRTVYVTAGERGNLNTLD